MSAPHQDMKPHIKTWRPTSRHEGPHQDMKPHIKTWRPTSRHEGPHQDMKAHIWGHQITHQDIKPTSGHQAPHHHQHQEETLWPSLHKLRPGSCHRPHYQDGLTDCNEVKTTGPQNNVYWGLRISEFQTNITEWQQRHYRKRSRTCVSGDKNKLVVVVVGGWVSGSLPRRWFSDGEQGIWNCLVPISNRTPKLVRDTDYREFQLRTGENDPSTVGLKELCGSARLAHLTSRSNLKTIQVLWGWHINFD